MPFSAIHPSNVHALPSAHPVTSTFWAGTKNENLTRLSAALRELGISAAGLGLLEQVTVGQTKMKVENAATELERHFAQRGEVESALTPAAAVASMIAFYRDVRAEECDLKADGDMLLFQWGTYDWGHGPRFEFDITRQFIVGAGEDDDIRQLHVTFRFKSDDSLRFLAAGDRWCRTPQELADFLFFIEGHPAYHAVGSRTDGEKELLFEGV